MSLRYQISIRILLISLSVLLIRGTIAIWQARNSVSEEVDSSINLAIGLGAKPFFLQQKTRLDSFISSIW